MKTKLILSAVVAASIALSSSAFAAGHDGPSGSGLKKVFKMYCKQPADGKLVDLLKQNADVNIDRDHAGALCKVIAKQADES